METYISILRGINVSGQKSIKMNILEKMYENLDFKNVLTYVQSGNVISQYRSEKPEILERKIQNQIKTDFGYDVPVIILTLDRLKKIVDANPLMEDPAKEKSFLHYTFLGSVPENYNQVEILKRKSEQEEIYFTDDAIYLYCPNGYGRTKLNNNFLERKLKITATTRNWKTTLKLLELAQK